ncbi:MULTISPECIES: pyridoxal phosphate-dependent aminotransferase [Nocardia]|uniref:Aspartate aminotransferase n=1 Tax=Nocardia africana TaxID=134964 RepID=A0A378X7Y5_9NOCA|nr:pyridoxal phosphate-dependent aminotransferase [Nocardia africana]MCC3317889.1 pyridoxal phosphate-dependent aminotransferase [Nocardia africana]SUA48663.1 Aspartate aminotransferase [Nocardia africana]
MRVADTVVGDPFFARLLETLNSPDIGYARPPGPSAGLDLGVGEARYPLPSNLCEAIGRIAGQADRQWYGDPRGYAPLRAAYLADLCEAGGRDAAVLITCGGKEAAGLAVRYLLYHHRGPILAPSPGWQPYTLWAEAAGAPVIGYDPIAASRDPGIVTRALVGTQPGVLVLNYPHNPTGIGMDQAVMDEIIAAAVRSGVAVISDEVYRVFGDPTGVSAAAAPAWDPHRHLIVDSVSKSLTVAGLRVGFLVADRTVVEALAAYRGAYASHTGVLSQRVAAELLTSAVARSWFAEVRRNVAATRTETAAVLTGAGVKVISHGALYLWCAATNPAALLPTTPGAVPAQVSDGSGFGAPGRVRVCTARDGLDAAAAAAGVIETLRRRG